MTPTEQFLEWLADLLMEEVVAVEEEVPVKQTA